MNYVICGGLPNMTGFSTVQPTVKPKSNNKSSPLVKSDDAVKTTPETQKSVTAGLSLPLLFQKLTFNSVNVSTTSTTTTKENPQGDYCFSFPFKYF